MIDKTSYNKEYYQKNKEKLLEYNRQNQKKKYANEEERTKILERNRIRNRVNKCELCKNCQSVLK